MNTTATPVLPTINTVERRTTNRASGLYAEIVTTLAFDAKFTLHLSKLDGETGWTIDATIAASGCPVHVNGFGARYCITHKVNEAIAAMLDAAAEAMVA